MSLELSVVIPFHNESKNITPLIEKIDNALKPLNIDYEIIGVDDCSSDDSLEILKSLKSKFNTLRVLHHLKNSGQSKAVVTGIRFAKGKYIATIDGDLQNDPDDIPKLYKALINSKNKNLKMVAGYRKKRKDTIYKRVASKIANKIRSSLLKDNTPDTGCGLKVFDRETFLKVPYFDHMHRFLPALFQREGADVISVEVKHHDRSYGKSHYNNLQRAWVGLIDLMGVMWLIKRSSKTDIKEF